MALRTVEAQNWGVRGVILHCVAATVRSARRVAHASNTPSQIGRVRIARIPRSSRPPSAVGPTTMSLNHPADLTAWQGAILAHQSPLRNLRNRTRSRQAHEQAMLLLPDRSAPESVDVLIVIETPTPSQLAALIAPMRFLAPEQVAVLTNANSGHRLLGNRSSLSVSITDHHDLGRALPGLRSVLTYGHYMRLGAMADITARKVGATSFVAQHGIVTPLAPPLPADSHLLAWSDADAAFWSSGRSDVEQHVVGSQLLYEASRDTPTFGRSRTRTNGDNVDTSAGITYLGQLHGHELPRHAKASAANHFCRTSGAIYRPHPSEHDLVSRMQHALWRSRGVRFDTTGLPMRELRTSIVSVFSTGVLEAAAAGIPAWVDFPNPPAWLEELWQRYSMSKYGSIEPTTVEIPYDEPARVIAELITTQTKARR